MAEGSVSVLENSDSTTNVYNFLELDKLKLFPLHDKYLRFVTRNVLLIQERSVTDKSGNRMMTDVKDPDLREKIHEQAFGGGEGFFNLTNTVGKRILEDDHSPIWDLHTLVGNLAKGNVIKRALEGRANCLDYAVTMKLLARLYCSKEVKEVDIVSYALKSIGTNGEGPDHYGMHVKLFPNQVRENPQEDWFVGASGIAAPLDVMEASRVTHKELYEFVKGQLSEKDAKNTGFIRFTVAHLYQIYKGWKRK